MGFERLNASLPSPRAVFLLAAALALSSAARAAVGVTEISSKDRDPVTVFYPPSAPGKPRHRRPFTLHFAAPRPPVRPNRRLGVTWPGAGASPPLHHDLPP